jgi:hypothetical protein
MAERYDKVEQEFGIKAYASPNIGGFAAVLKGRYSDFCVREGKQKMAKAMANNNYN